MQILSTQTKFKELRARAKTGTGLEPADETLYSYMEDAFGELKHLLPKYVVSSLKGRSSDGNSTDSSAGTSSGALLSPSDATESDVENRPPPPTPAKGKGKGKDATFYFIAG